MFRLCGGDNDQDFLLPRHTPLLNYWFVYTDHMAVIRGYASEERERQVLGCFSEGVADSNKREPD